MGVVFIPDVAANIVCVLFCFHRVDDLDKELKVLTATHSALQLEASKKGATLKETTFYLTTLKQDNDKLQEVQVLNIYCLSACLSVCRSPTCMSVWLSASCLHGCLSVCLHVWLSVCLHVWLSVCLSLCLHV